MYLYPGDKKYKILFVVQTSKVTLILGRNLALVIGYVSFRTIQELAV